MADFDGDCVNMLQITVKGVALLTSWLGIPQSLQTNDKVVNQIWPLLFPSTPILFQIIQGTSRTYSIATSHS